MIGKIATHLSVIAWLIAMPPYATAPEHNAIDGSVANLARPNTPSDRLFSLNDTRTISDLGEVVTLGAAGSYHSCARSLTGGAKCWGANGFGQLGDGTRADQSTPVNVSGLTTGVAKISAGDRHTCVLMNDGTVKCWGYNRYGQLGNGTRTDWSTPVNVFGLTGVTAISAGAGHTCALLNEGAVKCWGDNGSGQLGDGTMVDRLTPVNVTGLASGIVAISAGANHACAVRNTGGSVCWGENYSGQLGDGTTIGKSVPTNVSGLVSGTRIISTGWSHTCALMSNGGTKCWGSNYLGQLGDGTTENRYTPTDVIGSPQDAKSIVASFWQTCALSSSGVASCWGANGSGQLGNETTARSSPVPGAVRGLNVGLSAIVLGNSHTCGLTTMGGMKCWGSNYFGQLGNGTVANKAYPVQVSGLTYGVSAISTGQDHTCARMTDGTAKCWGGNGDGQIGDGTSGAIRFTPTDVLGLPGTSTAISAGGYHSCALTTAGGLRCWGYNRYGQLGDGTTSNKLLPVPVTNLASGVGAIATGVFHTCALVGAGTAELGTKCWGQNWYGQLGNGTTADRSTPGDVNGLTDGIGGIAAAEVHGCALTLAGAVKCWGHNYFGQLGDGTSTQRLAPADVSGLTGTTSMVVTGYEHTCAATNGGAKCWGNNLNGQLGDGTTVSRSLPVDVYGLTAGVVAVAAGGSHTCALTTAGGVKCWGSNSSGQLGDGTSVDSLTPVNAIGMTSGVVALAAGERHTCALTASGSAMCWGDNRSGQLGDGTAWQPPVDVSGFRNHFVLFLPTELRITTPSR